MTDTLVTPRVSRAMHFGAVSAGSMVLTQLLLAALQGLGTGATPANAIAVTVAAVPAFVVSRRWVWKLHGPDERARQAVLFWLSAVAGLVLSTALVAVLVGEGAPILYANLVNLAGFGVVWVAKYVFLDTVVFRRSQGRQGGATRHGSGGRQQRQ